MNNPAYKDSYRSMLATVQSFHDKHDLDSNGGEELAYRVALMAEELGEISACVTKGQPLSALSEECADLLILLIGTAISAEFDLNQAFWDKMKELDQRQRRTIHGRRRVSRFEEGESA
ncbi:MAG: nucleoside triphosphate pyrophosphohydrolase family protein [Arenicellales bacterium]|nr:nucleoside triphosphate pyrophosphohydrolase family protein [Arenicellales bacterium]